MGLRWSIGLAGWIVQDGNYDDFAVGSCPEFAVEFYAADELVDATGAPLRAELVDNNWYDVTARVVHADERGWVLDFGILAYCDGPPPTGVRIGSTISARVSLGVDPFFYFEDLARNPSWPDLIYTWELQEIWRETAPFIQSGNVLVRDESKRVRVSVPRTDAWHDDDGHGDYVFLCDRADERPKRRSATTR